MLPYFKEEFSDADDVFGRFEVSEREHIDVRIAIYSIDNYGGNATVVFRDRRDGKLYEANGSHCSCFGLEGQWEPEETSVAALRIRGLFSSPELQIALDVLEDEVASAVNPNVLM